MFIEILFKMLLFKGGVLIYAEHCIYIYIYIYIIYPESRSFLDTQTAHITHINPSKGSPLMSKYG